MVIVLYYLIKIISNCSDRLTTDLICLTLICDSDILDIMNFKQAIKLHNNDEVIDKKTTESINVLSVTRLSSAESVSGHPTVVIEGIGKQKGYGLWSHQEVVWTLKDAQLLKINDKYLRSIHSGVGKAKVNHLGSIQEPPPVVGVDGVASNLPAPVASGMKPNNVARISRQKVTDHIPVPFTPTSSLSPQKSGLLPQPSEQAVVPPTIPPELFCGLTPDIATVATLTAILIGLLKETTNADKIYFALRYARKTAMQSGIAQSDFDRVKDIICKKWKTIAAGSWMHKAFGTGDLKGI